MLLLSVLVLVPAFAWAQGFGGAVRVVDGDTLDVAARGCACMASMRRKLGNIATP